MTEQTPSQPPVPDYADIATLINQMAGPSRFSEALELHEWIKDLLQGGFTLNTEPATTTSGQQILTLDDHTGAISATVEFGHYWTARTALSATSPAASEPWWAACAGLIPARLILAASWAAEPGPSTVGELLEADGWRHSIHELAKDGVTVAMDGWTSPEDTRTALFRDEVHDHGWFLTYSDLRRVSVITTSLDTPPGVIAALATAD